MTGNPIKSENQISLIQPVNKYRQYPMSWLSPNTLFAVTHFTHFDVVGYCSNVQRASTVAVGRVNRVRPLRQKPFN